MKWPVKDPDDVLVYSVDWSRYLNTATISTVAWFIYNASGVKTSATPVATVNGLTTDSQSNTNTVASIQLSAGTAGVFYRIVCAMTDNGSLVTERVIQLPVREQ